MPCITVYVIIPSVIGQERSFGDIAGAGRTRIEAHDTVVSEPRDEGCV